MMLDKANREFTWVSKPKWKTVNYTTEIIDYRIKKKSQTKLFTLSRIKNLWNSKT